MMRNMEKIVFLLEEKWNTKSLNDAAEAVRACREYGFDADLQILDERKQIAWDEGVSGQAEQTAAAAFDTLCIADSARLLRQLKQCGAAFCAYSHSGNGNEDLSTAEYILMEPQWVDRDSLVKIWQRQRSIPWTILETERFIVREFVPGDLDAIYGLYDEEAGRFLEPPSGDRAKEQEILTSYIGRVYRLCGYGHWAVICKQTGELIGRVGFSFPPSAGPWTKLTLSPNAGEPDTVFGYLVRSDRRGQGVALEVGAAILQYGFEKLGFEAIGADAAITNTISDKILRKFSFIPVAEEQNQRYYILHITSWKRSPAHGVPNRCE